MITRKGNLKSSAGKLADKGKDDHPVTQVTLAECLKAFSGHAVVASEALVEMCVSGALVYVLGYWCQNEPRTKMEVIQEKLADALKAANPTKGESTLRGYLSTCKALYNHMVNPDHARTFGKVIEDLAESKSSGGAQTYLSDYLKGKGVTGLDRLKEFCGLSGSNTAAKVATPGDKIVAQMKTLGASIEDGKAQPAAMAKVIANAIPAEIKPVQLASASISRIVSPSDATKAAHDAAMHLAHVDFDAFDAFVGGLVKARDAMLETKPKADAKAKAKTAKPRGKVKTETAEAVLN